MPAESEQDVPEKTAPASGPTGPSAAGEDFTAPPRTEDLAVEAFRKLQEANQQLTDRLLRTQAEMENTRKRSLREKDEYLQYSLFQAVQNLVPILDGFELALQSGGSGEDYRKGVELIYQQFRNTLEKLGLEVMESSGQVFNPYLHEAVMLVETEDCEDNHVIEEMQRGYLFKNRLLRPARVKVAQKPAAQSSPPDSESKPE